MLRDSHGMENSLRDSSGSVAVVDFNGASTPTSEYTVHFFRMQNFGVSDVSEQVPIPLHVI